MPSCGVRPSMSFWLSVETNKYISKFFYHNHTILHVVIVHEMLWEYSDGDPITGAKIAIFDQYLALASITAGPSRVVDISTVDL